MTGLIGVTKPMKWVLRDVTLIERLGLDSQDIVYLSQIQIALENHFYFHHPKAY